MEIWFQTCDKKLLSVSLYMFIYIYVYIFINTLYTVWIFFTGPSFHAFVHILQIPWRSSVQACHHYWIWVCDWLLDCYRNTARPCTEFFAGRSQNAYANTMQTLKRISSTLKLAEHHKTWKSWKPRLPVKQQQSLWFLQLLYNIAMPNSVHIATLKGVS